MTCNCPSCGCDLGDGSACPGCGTDVTLLACLDAQPDAYFNRALEAFAAGRPGRGLEWLAACCAARPTDAPALRALARAWAQLGHAAAARDALDRAQAVDPDAPEQAAIKAVLDEMGATG
jgi:tetratricopeptide (TPR) repeat protein